MNKVLALFNLRLRVHYDKRFDGKRLDATLRQACLFTQDWNMLKDLWTVNADHMGNIRFIEHEEI